MKYREKYPRAWEWMKSLDALRSKIAALRECEMSARQMSTRTTTSYGIKIGSSGLRGDDFVCKAIDLQAELVKLNEEYCRLKSRTEDLLNEFANPVDAMFMWIVAVYGAKRDMLLALNGMSKSTYYEKLDRGMGELENVLYGEDAA